MPRKYIGRVVGPQGPQGPQGEPGERGLQGIQGEPGKGIPSGGIAGQALVKSPGEDYEAEWGPVVSNPNLIINWYLSGGGSQQGNIQYGCGRFPINQRTQTEYTGAGYTIDRWKLGGDNLKLSVHDGYIKIQKHTLSLNPYFCQPIENYNELLGKTVTASILYRTNITNGNIWLNANPNGSGQADKRLLAAESWNLESQTFVVDSNHTPINELFWIQFRSGVSAADNYFDVKAIKLELGDTQTLAHQENGEWVLNDPPPDFALELAKCQRYYCRYDPLGYWLLSSSGHVMTNTSGTRVAIALPVSMRANPAITCNNFYIKGLNSSGVREDIKMNDVQWAYAIGNQIFFAPNLEQAFSVGGPLIGIGCLSDIDCYIAFDAEL